MRLGLIAPEFPPDSGGMAELARGLAASLAATDDVTVFIPPRSGLPQADFEQRPVLIQDLREDAETLNAAGVDAWLALNAGLVPLAPKLESPFFAYFMGNDFLNPWLAYGGSWERIRRPYAARLRSALRRAAIRRAIDSAHGLLTISRRSAELIEEHLGVAQRRIHLHPPGVGDAFFQERREGRTDRLRILTVSRLSRFNPRKNVDGVLRAVRLLAGKIPIHYTVVGGGDDLPRLEDLAEELGIERLVSFTGEVEVDRLLACYADADLFVLAAKASKRDVEGFGIVYLEACASGVPVIGSREGGAVDAVEPGCNGILIPESSPRAIADGIEEFNSRRRDLTPERARAFAECYRWPRVAAGVRSTVASGL